MPVERANGESKVICTAEVLMLDALPAVLDQLYAHADRARVHVERVLATPTADGVMLALKGHHLS